MVDRAVSRSGRFLEKLMLWALEGEDSPFGQSDIKRIESTRKLVGKKRNKNRALGVLAQTPIRPKS